MTREPCRARATAANRAPTKRRSSAANFRCRFRSATIRPARPVAGSARRRRRTHPATAFQCRDGPAVPETGDSLRRTSLWRAPFETLDPVHAVLRAKPEDPLGIAEDALDLPAGQALVRRQGVPAAIIEHAHAIVLGSEPQPACFGEYRADLGAGDAIVSCPGAPGASQQTAGAAAAAESGGEPEGAVGRLRDAVD